VLDLFQPPRVYPRPTRVVLLNEPLKRKGDYQPRVVKRVLDMSPGAIKKRARQAEWARNKRRANEQWRQECNRRERERYAAMDAEQKAARRRQILEVKAGLAREQASDA
jgi:hypothetical protein